MVIVNGHGHIALVNAQAERLFGYRREEIVGQGISELIPERFRAHHRQHMKGYLKDATTRPMGTGLELFGRHKDGTEFPIEISLSPLETDEGLLVSAAIRDVSARKRAVADLAAAEALFRGAFDGSPIGMALTDDGGERRPRQRRAVRPHRAPRRRAHRLALRLARAPRRDRLRPQGDHAPHRGRPQPVQGRDALRPRHGRADLGRRAGDDDPRRRQTTRGASSSRCRTSRTAAATRRTSSTSRRTTR